MADTGHTPGRTGLRPDADHPDDVAVRDAALDLAFRLAGVAWWSWVPDEDRIVWSRHMAQLYGRESGWSPPSAAAYFDLVHPVDRDEKKGSLAAALAGGAPYQGEHRVVCPDGSERWHAVDAFVERRADGSVLRLLGVVRDLTDEKRLETALRESQGRLSTALAELAASEARYRFLADNSRDVIARVDADLRYLYITPSVTAVRGWSPEELVGRAIYEFMHPDERPQAERDVPARLVAGEVPPPVRLARLRCKDGSYRWTETMAEMTFTHGHADGYVIVSRDVTDRRTMERRNAEAAKLEGIGRLAGGLAHDLNNVLTAIRGNADLLRSSIPASTIDTESMDAIETAIRQAEGIAQRLVHLAGRPDRQRAPLAIDTAIAGMEPVLATLVERPRVLLIRPGAPGAAVVADRDEFELAIQHLVSNAATAIGDAGAVTVRTTTTSVSEHDAIEHLLSGRYVCVKVADTGVGIPPELRDRIFEPFAARSKRRAGAGLGLATVRSIMRRLDGAVTFESSTGVGSQFVLWFPLHEATPDAQPVAPGRDPISPPTCTSRAFRILLVDDESAILHACMQALERSGYQVDAAANGEDALRLLERDGERIDILVTDLAMPGMGGVALLTTASARWPHLRRLAMSGYADDLALYSDLTEAGVPFLSKPFGAKRLLDAVSELRRSARR